MSLRMNSVHLYTTLVIVICHFPKLAHCQSDDDSMSPLTSAQSGLSAGFTSSSVEPTLSSNMSNPSSQIPSSASMFGTAISLSVEPTTSSPGMSSISTNEPIVSTSSLMGVSSSSSVSPAAPTTSLQGISSSYVGVQTTPTSPVSLTSNPVYTPPVLTPSSYSFSSVLPSTPATPLMSSALSSMSSVSSSSIPVIIQPSLTATISMPMSSSEVSSSSATSTSSVSMSSSSIITSSTITTTNSISMSSSEVSISSTATTTSTTMSVPVITPQPTPCPTCCPDMSSDPFMGYLFNWPQTKPQEQATAPCPCDRLPPVQDSLFAFRKCGNGSTWGPPDASPCELSTTFKSICTNNTNMDTSFLISIAGQGKTLGDLVVIVALANEFLNQQKNQETVLGVVDNVLGDASEDLLKNTSKYTGLPNSILQLVDTFAAQATPGPYNYDSFKLLVNSVDTSSSSNFRNLINIGDNVAVIPQSVFNIFKPATVRVSSASFSKESLFSGRNDSLSLVTDVLSVTIIGKKVTDLQEKVKLIFRKLPLQGIENSAVCSYWKVFDTSGHLGDWSKDGCSLVAENSTHITCECDHLSAFAALKTRSTPSTTAPTGSSTTTIIIAVCVPIGMVLTISLIVIVCIVVVCCCRWRRKKRWGALTIRLRDKGSEYKVLHLETDASSPI